MELQKEAEAAGITAQKLTGEQQLANIGAQNQGNLAITKFKSEADRQIALIRAENALKQIQAQNQGNMAITQFKSEAERQIALIQADNALKQIQAQNEGLTQRATQQQLADWNMQILRGVQALQQGAQIGANQLENTSLRGQYDLAQTNLNPMTQNMLANRMMGRGTGLPVTQDIMSRYSPPSYLPPVNANRGYAPQEYGNPTYVILGENPNLGFEFNPMTGEPIPFP